MAPFGRGVRLVKKDRGKREEGTGGILREKLNNLVGDTFGPKIYTGV
jgi:hypothetical protein